MLYRYQASSRYAMKTKRNKTKNHRQIKTMKGKHREKRWFKREKTAKSPHKIINFFLFLLSLSFRLHFQHGTLVHTEREGSWFTCDSRIHLTQQRNHLQHTFLIIFGAVHTYDDRKMFHFTLEINRVAHTTVLDTIKIIPKWLNNKHEKR